MHIVDSAVGIDGQQGKRLEEREEKRELISRWQELLPSHKLKKLW